MTRKDYILIAEALRYARGYALASMPDKLVSDCEMRGVMAAAEHIAQGLVSDNPRFSREHFLAVVRGERELNSRPTRRQ